MSAQQHHETGAQEQHDAPVYSDSASAMPPDYSSREPSTVAHKSSPPMSTEKREAMLAEFAESKERSNDNWGGFKGSAGQFEPNDPSRPFRRLSQIMRGGVKKGEEKIPWTKPRTPEDGNRHFSTSEGGFQQTVAKGDQDGRQVL